MIAFDWFFSGETWQYNWVPSEAANIDGFTNDTSEHTEATHFNMGPTLPANGDSR